VLNRIAAIVITVSLSALPVYAADEGGRATATSESAAPVGTTDAAAVPEQAVAAPLTTMRAPEFRPSRPALLPSLYASYAALQAYDIYSTRRALAGGAHEANPAMTGIVGNPALFWSVKAAATVAPMMAAERLWKTNKAGAIAVMAAGNGLMAIVAAHNASVVNRQR